MLQTRDNLLHEYIEILLQWLFTKNWEQDNDKDQKKQDVNNWLDALKQYFSQYPEV